MRGGTNGRIKQGRRALHVHHKAVGHQSAIPSVTRCVRVLVFVCVSVCLWGWGVRQRVWCVYVCGFVVVCVFVCVV